MHVRPATQPRPRDGKQWSAEVDDLDAPEGVEAWPEELEIASRATAQLHHPAVGAAGEERREAFASVQQAFAEGIVARRLRSIKPFERVRVRTATGQAARQLQQHAGV